MIMNVFKLIQTDKMLHLLTCMLAFIMVCQVLQALSAIWMSFALALVVVLLLAFGKEIYDSTFPDNYFDWKDIKVDLIGIALGDLYCVIILII